MRTNERVGWGIVQKNYDLRNPIALANVATVIKNRTDE